MIEIEKKIKKNTLILLNERRARQNEFEFKEEDLNFEDRLKITDDDKTQVSLIYSYFHIKFIYFDCEISIF